MKNFNLILFTLLGGAATTACTLLDDNLLEKDLSPEYSKESTDTRYDSNGKFQALGYSYDITGEFLNRENYTRVLDIEKLYADHPEWVDIQKITDNGKLDIGFYTGENYREFVRDMMEKTGFDSAIASQLGYTSNHPDYAAPYFLPESMSLYMNERDRLLSNESFGCINLSKHYESLIIDKTPDFLYEYVSDVFKIQVNKFDPEQIVKNFGTHVLLSIKTGARIHLNTRSVIVNYYNEEEKKDIVLARLVDNAGMPEGIFDFGFSEADAAKNIGGENKSYHIGSQCIGWKVELQSDGSYKRYFDLKDWLASLNHDHRGLTDIDFGKTYPIYEFIEDPVKREAVKVAIHRYLESKEKPIVDVKPMHQLKSKKNGDTWWVYSKQEADEAINRWGDRYDGVVAFILEEPGRESTRPLHTLKSMKGDTWHAYTWEDVIAAQETYGDEYRGVDGYIYEQQQPDTYPMFRLKSHKTGDTWYAFSERDAYEAMHQWKDEMTGPEGYVYRLKY